MAPTEITNPELKIGLIPSPDSDWNDIEEFALTYDGYSIPGVEELANSRTAESLSELRAVLFFEQRRFRHFGYEPTGSDREYIKSLLMSIRTKVEYKELQ